MRILTAATRRIVSIATDLHIVALRIGQWAVEREVAAADRLVDAAHVALNRARSLVDTADAALTVAEKAADEASHKAYLHWAAAIEEARQLRRGGVRI